MNRRLAATAVALAALAASCVLSSCGGGNGLRFYKGTQTITAVSMGTTTTTTTTGIVYTVMPSYDGRSWLFLADGTDYVATLTGTNLNFMSQDLSRSQSSGMTTTATSIMLSNGTGTMDTKLLTLNLTLTLSQPGVSQTNTVVFNGMRE